MSSTIPSRSWTAGGWGVPSSTIGVSPAQRWGYPMSSIKDNWYTYSAECFSFYTFFFAKNHMTVGNNPYSHCHQHGLMFMLLWYLVAYPYIQIKRGFNSIGVCSGLHGHLIMRQRYLDQTIIYLCISVHQVCDMCEINIDWVTESGMPLFWCSISVLDLFFRILCCKKFYLFVLLIQPQFSAIEFSIAIRLILYDWWWKTVTNIVWLLSLPSSWIFRWTIESVSLYTTAQLWIGFLNSTRKF